MKVAELRVDLGIEPPPLEEGEPDDARLGERERDHPLDVRLELCARAERLVLEVDRPEAEVAAECVARVREEIGPVAAFKQAAVVKRLPKTRSGKILRATMRQIADGAEWKTPATIDDPAILEEIAQSLEALGYPRASIINS